MKKDYEYIKEDEYTDVNVLLEMLTDINEIFNDYLPCFDSDTIGIKIWAWGKETEEYFLKIVENLQGIA